MDNKSEVVKYNPWEKLAKTGRVKDVPLCEVLQSLEVPSKEAPDVKRKLMKQVLKITKPAR